MKWLWLPASPGTFWVRWWMRGRSSRRARVVDPVTHRLYSSRNIGSTRNATVPLELPRHRQLTLVEACDSEIALRLVEADYPILIRATPGEELPVRGSCLLDLVEAFWNGVVELERPPQADQLWVLLPLLPGMGWEGSPSLSLWMEPIRKLQSEAIVPFPVDLTPRERRAWASQLGEDRFEAVFHGGPPGIREVAQWLRSLGFSVFPAAPRISGGTIRSRDRDTCAAVLGEAAFLLEELGASEREVQELWRAARWLERSPLDLRAVSREGNLALLPGLSPLARLWVERTLSGEAESELQQLHRQFFRCAEC